MMVMAEIEKLLDSVGVEYRYHHFETEEAVNPPFICWLNRRSDNFSADGKVYHKVESLDIELYTDTKNPDLEGKIEELLDNNGIFWNKTEVYIESENMYEVLYEMEV